MATDLQQKAVDEMVVLGRNNKVIEMAPIMRKVGYSEAMATHPKRLTESKGFKEICKKNGLTPNLITKALVSDIKKKPKKRLGELSLGADILRMRESEGGNKTQVNFIVIPSEVMQRYDITPSTKPNSKE